MRTTTASLTENDWRYQPTPKITNLLWDLDDFTSTTVMSFAQLWPRTTRFWHILHFRNVVAKAGHLHFTYSHYTFIPPPSILGLFGFYYYCSSTSSKKQLSCTAPPTTTEFVPLCFCPLTACCGLVFVPSLVSASTASSTPAPLVLASETRNSQHNYPINIKNEITLRLRRIRIPISHPNHCVLPRLEETIK